MTPFFRNKQGKKIKTSPPRDMAEINKEYSELIGKVGQAQYQAFIYKQETERLNQEIRRVNSEAAERTKLEAEAKLTETKEEKNA